MGIGCKQAGRVGSRMLGLEDWRVGWGDRVGWNREGVHPADPSVGIVSIDIYEVSILTLAQ